MGTGSTWKSPAFDKDGKFYMNFSEEIGGRQNIYFAESTDLLHWTRLKGEEYRFVQNEQWYIEEGTLGLHLDHSQARGRTLRLLDRKSGSLEEGRR